MTGRKVRTSFFAFATRHDSQAIRYGCALTRDLKQVPCYCSYCRHGQGGFTLRFAQTRDAHSQADAKERIADTPSPSGRANATDPPSSSPSIRPGLRPPSPSFSDAGPSTRLRLTTSRSDDAVLDWADEDMEERSRNEGEMRLSEDARSRSSRDNSIGSFDVASLGPAIHEASPGVSDSDEDRRMSPSAPLPMADGLDHFVHHDMTPAERMSYTNAAVSSITGAPHSSVANGLAFSAALTRQLDPDVDDDAITDPYEAYRRLGIDSDDLVKRFAMCSDKTCCHLVPMSEVKTYRTDDGHPHPDGGTCRSSLFKPQDRQRRPLKVFAFTPPSTVLKSLLREPTFVTELQAWRKDHQNDQIAKVPPISGEPVPDRHFPMTSVFDGSAWRRRAFNKRRTIEAGIVRDVTHGSAKRLVALEFGLLAAINLDW